MAVLILKGISKRLQGRLVVSDVTFRVEEGELLALLGPSGCGKTTTLRMIAGLETPWRGEVWLDGRLVSAFGRNLIPPADRHVGMVFQDLALWPHVTVQGHIEFPIFRRLTKKARKRRVEEVLHKLNLGEFRHRYPHMLSGGQQQLVALARAIAPQPKILLMDEPLSNLDVTIKEAMYEEIIRLQRELGITILYVTHDQQEAFFLAQRLVVMNEGEIEQIATPEEVYHSPASEFVARFLGGYNLLEGWLIGMDSVESPFGLIKCKPVSYDKEKVLLLLRPQSFAVEGDGLYVARVLRRSFVGGYYRYTLDFNGIELVLFSSQVFQEGSQLRFSFKENPTILLPKED